jgi:hypothetical protein
MPTVTAIQAPDLSKTTPRSCYATLGPFILLPRIIDKCRAALAGTLGEYASGCGLDMLFFNHFAISYDAFKAAVETGKTDEELLAWVMANIVDPVDATEEAILAWSYDARTYSPDTKEKKAYYETYRRTSAAHRTDVTTWFALLEAEEQAQ